MRFQQHLCHCKNLKWQAIRLACKLVEERAHERMKAVYPKTARDCVVHGNSIVRCCVIDKVYPSDELFWRLRPRLQRGDQLIALTRRGCRGKRDIPRLDLAIQCGPHHLDNRTSS